MAQQERMPGNAKAKRNPWIRGGGPNSMRGELKGGIALERKRLNRKVRHEGKAEARKGGEGDTGSRGTGYKRTSRTMRMVDFT